MPPKGLDCSGFFCAIQDQDGNWHSLDGIPVIEEGFMLTDEEAKRYNFAPSELLDFSLTIPTTTNNRAFLKLVYTGRELRRRIRRMEKERRKRLKGGDRG